jgi:hypothetical protein
MKYTRFARQMVAVSFLLALPAGTFAQQQAVPAPDSPGVLTSENSNPDSDEVRRAGAEAWFRQNIEPSLTASRFQESSSEPGPVLYDANDVAPMPGKPIPERRIYAHRAQVGSVGAVLMAGDLPPTRADWNDASDWNAPIRPEMFRFYFERVPPPKPPICPVVQ